MEHYVLAVAAEIQSLLKEKRTRHPPIRASKREKITDLIDLLLSTNVKNKVVLTGVHGQIRCLQAFVYNKINDLIDFHHA